MPYPRCNRQRGYKPLADTRGFVWMLIEAGLYGRPTTVRERGSLTLQKVQCTQSGDLPRI